MTDPKPNPFPGFFMLAGVLVIAGGMWWISKPATFIVGGLALVALGFFGRGRGEPSE